MSDVEDVGEERGMDLRDGTAAVLDGAIVVLGETRWRGGRRIRVKRKVNCTALDLESVQTTVVIECKLHMTKQVRPVR
jgi:hypothetical protein